MSLSILPSVLDHAPRPHDLVYDKAGGFDAAEPAENGGAFVYIKQGTYTGAWTFSGSTRKIYIEPGTIVSGAITLSGDKISLFIGSGSNIQGLITLSGDDCQLHCENGVDTVGVLLSGARGFHDGGGWDTLHNGGVANDGIDITGIDCIAQNCTVQTTGGGASSEIALLLNAARVSVIGIKVLDSDSSGIFVNAADCVVWGCKVIAADDRGIEIVGVRARIIGNYIEAAGIAGDGIEIQAGATDGVCRGNVVQVGVGLNPIQLNATSENWVVTGNRCDGAVVDGSGTSIVANNDETAF